MRLPDTSNHLRGGGLNPAGGGPPEGKPGGGNWPPGPGGKPAGGKPPGNPGGAPAKVQLVFSMEVLVYVDSRPPLPPNPGAPGNPGKPAGGAPAPTPAAGP